MSGALGPRQDAVVHVVSKDSIEAGEGGTESGSEPYSQYAQH